MPEKFRPIVCFDFDGVIHSYTSGWKGPNIIPDPPVNGAIEFLEDLILSDEYQVSILSSRSHQTDGITAMKHWLVKNGLSIALMLRIDFPKVKPPAMVTIDDRAICFLGDYSVLKEQIKSFKVWYSKS